MARKMVVGIILSSEVFINRMPSNGISVGEQLAGSIPAEELKVEQPVVKPSNGYSNGASNLQKLTETTTESENKTSREVSEKQKELASVFREMHLTDEVYDEFVARGRAGASNINGDRLSMEQVKENLKRLGFLRDEKPKKVQSSSQAEDGSSSIGVFADNSSRKQTDE